MNHFYLNPKVKSNLGMNFYEMKLRRKKKNNNNKMNIDFKFDSFKYRVFTIQLRV